MSEQPKEVLLRGIFEYVPASAYVLAAVFLLLASELAFVIPTVAFALA